MNIELKWIAPEAERQMVEMARVSSPRGDKTAEPEKLLRYCMKHGHWSIFEMASMCVTIQTSRAISAQILRHRSFSFQEFSQRYAEATDFEPFELRKQGKTNRQVGDEVFNPEISDGGHSANEQIAKFLHEAKVLYSHLLEAGVARESARMILPMCVSTTLHMTGTIRSWIHYLQARTYEGAQKEHRDIALEIQEIFDAELPAIAQALYHVEAPPEGGAK